jgi:2-polyprenyl-6-methoxyphenol hydroxylase-like FAD-dependent oxidoreductase
MKNFDVVIVGGGAGGSALATTLAAAGLEVQLLERLTEFGDRVRGEWIAPWGVAEAKRLSIYDALMAAGGHHLSRHIAYDQLTAPTDAEANALPIGMLHPESPGPLCIEHVILQNTMIRLAAEAGAHVRRGVTGVEVHPGPQSEVRFRHDGVEHVVSCRMLVGADGRSSVVRRRLGIELFEDPISHLIAGLLIEAADEWPDDLQAMGQVGDIGYLVFPQGGGKIRLYAEYDATERGRFSGPNGAEEFLAAFDMDCVPHSQSLAKATPIGPCRSFPSQDAWTDRPFAPGAVLVGDAAGYNDPILGQGLSITLRDARLVRDALLAGNDWNDSALFEPYADERRERMCRLRFVARVVTELFARFGEQATERRKRAFRRIRNHPENSAILAAPYLGPELVDGELFSDALFDRIFEP